MIKNNNIKHLDICQVRVCINNGLPRKYSIVRNFDKKQLIVTIQATNQNDDLKYIVSCIKDELIIRKRYRVVFNFKSAPNAVRQNVEFREAIIKIFQMKEEIADSNCSDIDTLAEILVLHIKQYGANPNISEYYHPHKKVKILNYMKNVLGMPTLSQEDSTLIAQKMLEIES